MMDAVQTPRVTASAFDVPWRIRDAILAILLTEFALIVVLLLTLFVVSVGAVLSVMGSGEEAVFSQTAWLEEFLRQIITGPGWLDLWLILHALLMVLFMSLCVFRRHPVRPEMFLIPGRAVADTRYALGLLIVCILVTVGVLVGIISLIVIASGLLRGDPEPLIEGYVQGLEQESQLVMTPEMGWLRVITGIVIGPPIEELLYRGCLYAALRKRLAPWSANVVSSAVFAVSHFYVFSFPTILVAGVLAAYAYERTRSLRGPIIFHMLWNTYCAAFRKPLLWAVLAVVVAGLFVWIRRSAGAVAGGQRGPSAKPHRRLWWKIYAWLFVGFSLLGHLADPAEAWTVFLGLPAYVGVFLYAYRRRMLPGVLWLLYGFLYVGWTIWELLKAFRPQALEPLYLQATNQGLPLDVVRGMVGVVIGVIVLVIAPSVVVLWRLATRREP